MDKRMNILMILDNAFNPDLRVQKEINSLIKLGFNITLICWDQDGELPELEQHENFIIHRIKVIAEKQQGIKKIVDLFKFMKLAKKKIKSFKDKIDYLYIHDFLMLPLGIYLKLFIIKKPLIYDAHEIYHLMEWEKYPPLLRKVIFFIEKKLLKFVDELIVVNQKRKDFYSKYYKKKDINIIGNWYDPYKGENLSLRQEYSIPENEILISYFGVINFDERPIDKIINALIPNENIHFFIAGVGKHEKKIEEMASNNERIYYLGWQKDIRKYLSDIDFIVYYLNDKRKYFEYTAPNTLYLALSHNIPLITNVPGESEELISEYNTGYFINDLNSLYTDIDFDKTSSSYFKKKEGISKIRDRFEWSENEKKYSQIFKSLKHR